jgi:hypothetical protein
VLQDGGMLGRIEIEPELSRAFNVAVVQQFSGG